MVAKVEKNKNQKWLETSAKHVAPTNARCFDIVAERAEGAYLWDVNGTRYIDFGMGIAVNNVGHCHPEVVKAAKNQIDKFIHGAMVTSHVPLIELSKKLAEIAPEKLDTVFLNNTGGEAIDAAIKFARFVTQRPNIIAFTGAFHGRTLLATALTTAKSYYREGYEPLPSGIYHVPYPYCYRCPVKQEPNHCKLECFELLEKTLQHQVKPNTVAAIIMEPVLGEGGYVVPATGYKKQNGYMERLRELCDKYGIMLIFDEVQTGFGRTGKWFACEHWDIVPDALVVAKGIASGFPLAGVISRKELMEKWSAGRHGSTYGGNPVSCSAALASIKVIEDDNLLDNARVMGNMLVDRFNEMKKKYPVIGEVRGLGLMIGVELIDKHGMPDGKALLQLVNECFKRNLLLLDCGSHDHVIRFVPPLNVTKEQLEEALAIFEAGLKELD
jgi:4-aminobutyrate aminotransferase